MSREGRFVAWGEQLPILSSQPCVTSETNMKLISWRGAVLPEYVPNLLLTISFQIGAIELVSIASWFAPQKQLRGVKGKSKS
jgi:hypothetical protein